MKLTNLSKKLCLNLIKPKPYIKKIKLSKKFNRLVFLNKQGELLKLINK